METAEKIFEKLEEYTDQLLEQLKEIRENLKQEDKLFKEKLSKEKLFEEESWMLSEKFPGSPYWVLLEDVDLMTEYLKRNRELLTEIMDESGRRRRSFPGEGTHLSAQKAALKNGCDEIEKTWERIKEAAGEKIDEKRTENLLRDYLEACREMNRSLRQRETERNAECTTGSPKSAPPLPSVKSTVDEQRRSSDRRTVKEKFCPCCSNPVSEEERFCRYCGSRLPKTSADASRPVYEARSAPRYAPPGPDYLYRQGHTGSPAGKEKSERTSPASMGPAGSGGGRRKTHGSGVLDSLKKVFSRDKKKTSEKKKAERSSGKPGAEKENMTRLSSHEKNESKQNRQPGPDSPNIVTDEVQFKAAAPAKIETGSSFELKLYMYRQEEKALVSELLQEFGAPAAAATSGIFEVARQQELKVTVQSEDVEIKEKTARLLWNGRLALCSFLLYLPEAFAKKQAIVQARVYSGIMVLADLRLILKVKGNEPQNLNIPVEMRRIRSAFASYSSKDRARVVARLQGMQAVNPELDLFFDRESLRTGEHWEERLFREIEARDILYLFWSRSAAASEWVNKEWHHALETGGENAVEPVPLEPPEICPPPEELSGRHFDNWALRYMRAND